MLLAKNRESRISDIKAASSESSSFRPETDLAGDLECKMVLHSQDVDFAANSRSTASSIRENFTGVPRAFTVVRASVRGVRDFRKLLS